MSDKIIRWIKGYVEFAVKGKFPERMINLLNLNGILYWDTSPTKNGFKASMYAKDYPLIKKLSKTAKVKTKITNKKGLIFFTRKNKKRKGLVYGGIIGMVLVSILSQFIWVVEINGNNKIGNQEITPILEKCGIYSGAYKKSIDSGAVGEEILLNIPELRWVSVNVMNNIAKIEVMEKTPKPKIKKNYTCNIIAGCDGVVTKSNVKNGTNETKIGSAVVKNQVLISSIMTYGEDVIKYVHAEGEIFADVKYSKEFVFEKSAEYYQPLNVTTERKNINFLWFDFPFGFSSTLCNNNVKVYDTYKLKCNEVYLPMGYQQEKSFYFDIKKANRNSKEILNNKRVLYELFAENESFIKSRKISFSNKNGKAILKVDYLVNKDIANKQKIHINP